MNALQGFSKRSNRWPIRSLSRSDLLPNLKSRQLDEISLLLSHRCSRDGLHVDALPDLPVHELFGQDRD